LKITILLRYPKFENSFWKKELIENLIADEKEISLVFGESSYWRQLKAAFKLFGFNLLKKKKDIAAEKKINLYNYFQTKIKVIKINDLNSLKAEELIKKLEPDYILLLGTGIIRKNILTLPKYKTVHCHHGWLPKYRGVNTAEWSVYYGDDIYITTHFVDPKIDTGEILLRKRIEIDKTDSIESVRKKCRVESVDLILKTFELLVKGGYKVEIQNQEEGKQFFDMHPIFKEIVNKKLKTN
jgi:methionyl-tRNA formyltransferase